jgi:hypothetical protein
MPLWFVISLLVPACLVLVALIAASLSSARADRELRDEERARAQSLRQKPGA